MFNRLFDRIRESPKTDPKVLQQEIVTLLESSMEAPLGLDTGNASSVGDGKIESSDEWMYGVSSGLERKESKVTHLFAQIKEEAEKRGDPKEQILIGQFTAEASEREILRNAGFSSEAIEAGRFSRADLLRAGFVFINVIGDGEKPILNAVIDGINLGARKLLTAAEFNKVVEYQNRHPEEFGWGNLNINSVTEDMFRFLAVSNSDPRPPMLATMGNAAHIRLIAADSFPSKRKEAKPKQWKLESEEIRRFWKYLMEEGQKIASQRGEVFEKSVFFRFLNNFLKKYFSDIFLWSDKRGIFANKARGYEIGSFEVRAGKLKGAPSPFLDSGFHFEFNQDFTIKVPGQKKAYRLNMVNIILALRGISEMANPETEAWDQHYMTIREFAQLLYVRSPEERKESQEQEDSVYAQKLEFDLEKYELRIWDRLLELARSLNLKK